MKRKALREPAEQDIRRAAMAICRETRAGHGEAPCYEIVRETGENWPPKSCNYPSCVVLATAALVCFLNPNYPP